MTAARTRAGEVLLAGGPFLEFDLRTEVDRLHRETTWNTGRNARTLMKYDDFRVVLTALKV